MVKKKPNNDNNTTKEDISTLETLRLWVWIAKVVTGAGVLCGVAIVLSFVYVTVTTNEVDHLVSLSEVFKEFIEIMKVIINA